jgi:hypothetical protein
LRGEIWREEVVTDDSKLVAAQSTFFDFDHDIVPDSPENDPNFDGRTPRWYIRPDAVTLENLKTILTTTKEDLRKINNRMRSRRFNSRNYVMIVAKNLVEAGIVTLENKEYEKARKEMKERYHGAANHANLPR